MNGIVLKKTASTFDVLLNGKQINCMARGGIKQDAKLQAGDHVELQQIGDDIIITKLFPRKNQLTRPYISNLDQLIIVISSVPKPDFLLVDKLLIGCQIFGIEPILVINKSDILPKGFYDEVLCQYGFALKKILLVSAKTGEGVQELKQLLDNKLSSFAGQSAVGKTSLLNAIFPNLNQKTDGLSKKIQMGKNTTRDTQIFVYDKNTLIADTPGFSVLRYEEMDPAQLRDYYPEFAEHSKFCLYNDCRHISEKEHTCGVLQALKENKINQKRYNRYVELYEKNLQSWRKKYD